ncbi:uncharacterized protein LOC117171112 [Belonocnema kinseyi]|uniref:uncharacterized protein LOC117171112 n=1 Tax=Belonocnema kinseyi TaxID=2817044 RepID=UPI00143CE509|nr:uncharacterized protein LOC117171112 [Belonocnema kinseyi]
MEDVSNRFPYDTFTIFGDFNMPYADWNRDLDRGPSCSAKAGSSRLQAEFVKVVSNSLDFLNFTKINDNHNVHGSLLDLIFTNHNPDKCRVAIDPLLPVDDYHPPLLLDLVIRSGSVQANTSLNHNTRSDFKNANLSAICTYLGEIDWSNLLTTATVDESVDIFYSHLYIAFDYFVPVKNFKTSSFPLWFNRDLINLILAKKAAHAKYKRTRNLNDYLQFSFLRVLTSELSDQCYSDYIMKTENSIIANPNRFWVYVNSIRQINDITSQMCLGDKHADTNESIANLFSNYFNSVYTTPTEELEFQTALFDVFDFSFVDIAAEDIKVKLMNLDVNKGARPDGVPPSLIKSCCLALIEPLQIIFNKSIINGYFPSVWKMV